VLLLLRSDDTALASSTMLLLLAQAFCVRHNSCCTTSSYVGAASALRRVCLLPCYERRPGHISYAPYVRFLFCVQSQVRQIVGRQSRLLALCPSSTGWGVRFCRCTGRTRRGLGFFTPGTVARAWPLGSDVRAFGHKGFAVAPCATHIRVCEKFAVFFQLSHTPNRPGLFTRACRW
jgi:hypothetical protein